MQALDRSFLVDLGIDHLAPGDEEDLLAEVYSELELDRKSTRLNSSHW